MEKPIVIITFDDDGSPMTLFDEDVHVFWIDERVPNDAVYQHSPTHKRNQLITMISDMSNGFEKIGSINDGSPEAKRALEAVYGKPN